MSGRATYVPYEELGSRPNIVVDGESAPATRLVLSHWPHSGTPAPLKADTSAEIVLRYLTRPDLAVDVGAASNSHYDQDGLVGLYALLEPTAALADRDLLIDVAAAGDFATCGTPSAARAAFVLAAFADPAFSPLDPGLFQGPYPDLVAALHRALLPRLPEIIHAPERFRAYWEGEDAFLSASELALRAGDVTIEEVPDVDLAIVRIPERWPLRPVHRFAVRGVAACHPMAVHNRTARLRVLTLHGRRYDLALRYESWVQLVSRRPAPRVDLGPLALVLTAQESDGAEWRFDGVDRITPRLRLTGADGSRLAAAEITTRVVDFLAAAPAAWDPYDGS